MALIYTLKRNILLKKPNILQVNFSTNESIKIKDGHLSIIKKNCYGFGEMTIQKLNRSITEIEEKMLEDLWEPNKVMDLYPYIFNETDSLKNEEIIDNLLKLESDIISTSTLFLKRQYPAFVLWCQLAPFLNIENYKENELCIQNNKQISKQAIINSDILNLAKKKNLLRSFH